jgi:branched-chain amino acid transport system ATP-binding protein
MTEATRKPAVLNVADVSVHFGGVAALSDVDLQVQRGSTHCIIGPNGAGKSTLVNVLTGQLRPNTGQVHFDGQSLDGARPHAIHQRGITRVFQTPSIFDELSLHDNVAIAALARRDGRFRFNLLQRRRRMGDAYDQARAKLTAVGLADQLDTQAQHLARGDKRRLELAICLAAEPRLLLLDEPTAGMSRHETEATIDLLKRIATPGVTKVVIEHDMHLVFSLADRLTVLHQGAVIADGPPEAVRSNEQVVEAYLGGARE